MSTIKNILYAVSMLAICVECLAAELIINNLVAYIAVMIIDLNFIYVLWRVSNAEDDEDEQ